ncbi:efflux RND transporter periplasmic adaptor subunit [Dinghuibacter silviterrae]|nr:efflux RND transporter periplasmic adaptor subunit [Dinghuibacter silviterrae]
MNKPLALLCVIAVFFSTACHHEDDKPTPASDYYTLPDSLAKTLDVAPVRSCPMVNAITLTGKISFNNDNVVKIYPMVSGNMSGVNVALGDYVHAGEDLGVIRSSEMAGYTRDLVNAQTNIQITKRNLDAEQDLFKGGLASQSDVIAADAAYKQAQSELARAQQVLAINGGGATQGLMTVKSPIDGFVVEKFVTNNQAIRADNGTNLFTISDLNNVWILANVYESNIQNVHLGDSATITTLSYPGKVFKGKVDKISNVLDPTNKVMSVRVVLSNPGYLLKPEMFASVTISNKTNQQSLCVPSSALIFDNSQYFVLVVGDKHQVQMHKVTVINSVGDQTYISSGVNEGDKVLASQALLIYAQLNS